MVLDSLWPLLIFVALGLAHVVRMIRSRHRERRPAEGEFVLSKWVVVLLVLMGVLAGGIAAGSLVADTGGLTSLLLVLAVAVGTPLGLVGAGWFWAAVLSHHVQRGKSRR
jgi:hypothetical protein